MMNKNIVCKGAAIGLVAFAISASAASAGEQAKQIINGLPPEIMNELLEKSREQPGVHFTSIGSISANKHRFLFVWPGTNPVMTYDEIERNFADRFLVFADRLKPFATGFCLPSRDLVFGMATYGEERVNVAYRDIEVRYQASWQPPCPGRYIAASDVEEALKPKYPSLGYGAGLTRQPLPRPNGQAAPDSLTPFLGQPPSPPPQ
jgi:hypothetical protein